LHVTNALAATRPVCWHFYSIQRTPLGVTNKMYMAFCSLGLTTQRRHDRRIPHAHTIDEYPTHARTTDDPASPRSGHEPPGESVLQLVHPSLALLVAANLHTTHPCICNPNNHAPHAYDLATDPNASPYSRRPGRTSLERGRTIVPTQTLSMARTRARTRSCTDGHLSLTP
jgi:hypothetical protein